MWPILCTINELPVHLRRKHVLLGSLWFGSEKSNIHVFFKPLVNEMVHLNDVGFTWVHPDNKTFMKTKAKVLVGVCDSVACPLLQNMRQFNGRHGCGYCLDSGVTTEQGNGITHVYPYTEPSILRDVEDTMQLAIEAFIKNEVLLGVKGPTILSLLPTFNYIEWIDS